MTADDVIAALELIPHPEGGYFRETYRSPEQLRHDALPARFRGARPMSTAIYFLVTRGSFSALHRIAADECWHFYAGDTLEVVSLDPRTRRASSTLLGMDLARGERPQAIVPAGVWFGARLASERGEWALVGCTVAPGFDFGDFELATREALIEELPEHARLVDSLTRS